ncbi:MAG: hypothetical protein MJ160_06850 [Treponema sp.]|nr:hypothetical protein [Treponema sp.]
MERKFSRLKKLILPVLLLVNASLFAQVPSVIERIRFPVWAEVDAYPGLESGEYDSDEPYPVSRIKEIVPFLLNGMVYGWDFVYVPSDKARGVEEYFEITEIQNLESENGKISYSSPWIQDNKFNCWVDYTRTDFQIQNYYLWSSIKNPVIQGRGYGSLEDGFDGIKKAAENALKNAVREHYRTKIKNKPKEITGSVLIRKVPTLGIDAGQYVIVLDFFLEYGKIKEYTLF